MDQYEILKPELQSPLVARNQTSLEYYGSGERLKEGGWESSEFFMEIKKQVYLAGPLIAVNILLFCVQMISLMFVGHLGELALSGASMATSFASVTGFNVLLGMGSALETMCGQAYGAKQYSMLGIYLQRSLLWLFILGIPLGIIWFYTTQILIALGQNVQVSVEAGEFIQWMIPSLFAYGPLQCIIRFLQTQNIVAPMLITSAIASLLHIFVCWILVFKFGLGSKGAAMANTIFYWINVLFLALYVKFSPSCIQSWTGFSKETFHGGLNFLKLAVPSAIMICLEYWAFEMVVLLSGLLPNPKLETSVLSISLNTCWMVYMISVGLGGALSTRVSNELGAGRPSHARLAILVMTSLAITEGVIIGTTTILVRHFWGRLYSNEEEVIKYAAAMLPLLAVSNFMDGIQCVLSGAARGCGWQNVCSLINLGAYYGVGIPSAIILAFVFHVGGKGLWMGIICGLIIQLVVLIPLNLCTNWDKEARKAMERVQH